MRTALAAALDGGALPALEVLFLKGTPASAAARAAVYEARLHELKAFCRPSESEPESQSESESEEDEEDDEEENGEEDGEGS